VVIARLTHPRGNRGELCAVPLSDHRERYQQLKRVWVGGTEYALERVWYHKDRPIFKFRGIDTIGQAEQFAGLEVEIPAGERFTLPEGEYYFADLVGCRIVDSRSGSAIGIVTGWQEIGGPVVLEVDGGRVLIPFARAILPEIDVNGREIRADLPEGLLDLNRPDGLARQSAGKTSGG
jgi:16S rRNA processing protein RimM